MDPIEELKRGLRSAGEPAFGGSFTIDPIQARQKLERFRLEDPRRYVVSLVQGAVARGATHIDFDLGLTETVMRFDGAPLDVSVLEDLPEALYGAPRDAVARSARHLALGVFTAQALDPSRIELAYGAHRLVLRGDTSTVEAVDPPEQGFVIRVKEPLGKRTALRFYRDVFHALAERRHLNERCVVSETRIHIHGERISHGLALSPSDAPWSITEWDDGLGIAVGFAAEPESRVELIVDGARVETVRPWEELPHVVGRVACDAFSVDISDAAVVRDAAFERAMERFGEHLRAAVLRLPAKLELERAGVPVRTIVREWLASHAPGSLLDELGLRHPLLALPLFGHAVNLQAPVSLRDIWQHHSRTGEVPMSPVLLEIDIEVPGTRPGDLDGELLVHAPDDTHQKLLRLFFGDAVVEGGDSLRARLRRRRNRRRWRARPAAPRLPAAGAYRLASALVDAPGVSGEVAVESVRNLPSRACFIKNGHVLWEKMGSGPVPGFTFVVEAEFTPTEDWSGIEPDDVYVAAMRQVACGLVEIFDQLVRGYAETRGRMMTLDREPFRRWVLATLGLRVAEDAFLRLCRAYPVHRGATESADWAARDALLADAVSAAGGDDTLALDLGAGRPTALETHPVADLRLFRATSGKHLTLRDLAARIDRSGELGYYALTVPRAQQSAQGVRATDAQAAMLRRIFGARRVVQRDEGASPLVAEGREAQARSALAKLDRLQRPRQPSEGTSVDMNVEADDDAAADGDPNVGSKTTPVGTVSLDATTPPLAETLLLRAVHDELLWLRVNHAHHVEALALDVLELADLPFDRAVEVSERGIRIGRAHPLVAGCLAAVDDPVTATVLASVVFSAVNARWDEITDDHERAFHDDLARRLLQLSPE